MLALADRITGAILYTFLWAGLAKVGHSTWYYGERTEDYFPFAVVTVFTIRTLWRLWDWEIL